ncbi:hypothetical protein [Parasphingorhabdus sp.]|uniref:hypothetical protein n=1 Tax=Parasphingorhabdus sp. TaxID=2709688 RepID=UPI003C755F33
MIGPIFYILLIFVVVALPAIGGWKLGQEHGQSIRMAGTILAGQLILTPAVAYTGFFKDKVAGENPAQTALIYAAMALMVSIMTFVVLEMKNSHKSKNRTVPVVAIDMGNDSATVKADFVEPQ